jgi:nitrite reductase/ring-hydroxylating ferredoxin subunit
MRIGDRLFAGSSMCPHEDVSLADGSLGQDTLICPGHGYEFELETGQCGHDPELRWKTYEITVLNGDIYVDLI